MATEKDRIAKAALELVPEQGAILLDAGTTTARLARLLPADRDLTVVTNAMDIATVLAGNPGLTVLVVGGRLRTRTLAAVDSWAEQMLAELYVDVAFVATNGVSVQRGLTTPDQNEAAAKSLMVEHARRTVLLADHSKVNDDHLVRFAAIQDVDTLVTDTGIADAHRAEFEVAGVQVVRA
jgi:DeoR family fructose operon transcriptional repressor